MGRHEAYRPTVSERVGSSLNSQLKASNRFLRRGFRNHPNPMRSLYGFFMAAGLIMVSIIDPYSGQLASASTIQVFDAESDSEFTVYGDAEIQSVVFERDGFSIVTAKDRPSLFVQAAGVPDPGTAKAFAYELILKRKWGVEQYSCLVKLWERESNWRVNAKNKSSGAYGIPQALPGTKMATEGADWQTNPETQIRWGLKYIASRYKTPCGALAHSNERGWY